MHSSLARTVAAASSRFTLVLASSRWAGAALAAAALLLAAGPAARADVAGDLTLEIAATPDSARTNERITLELLACNSGAAELTGAAITHVVPAGLTSTIRTDGGACTSGACGPGATVTFALGTLGAGSCRLVGMAPLVTAANGEQIVLSAELSTDGDVSVEDTLTVEVLTSPALAVQIDESSDPVAAGGVLSYTVAFANRTTTNVLGAELTMQVPAGTSVLAIEDGGVEAAGEITWTLGTLTAGTSGRRRFSVTVDEGALDGTALVASAEATGGAGQSARATQLTAIDGAEPLSVHVTAAPDPAALNSRLIYDITACNAGPLEATGATATLLIPEGLTSLIRTDGGTCTSGACGTGNIAAWDLGTLAPGVCRTVQATPQVTADTNGELIRPAVRLTADGEALAVATRTVARLDSPQLALGLAEDREPVGAGESLTYTVTYGVPTASANVLDTVLRAWVPPGTTVQSISGGGTEADGVITWELATLRSGESGQRQFTVTIDEDAADGTALAAAAEIDAGGVFGAMAAQATAVNAADPMSIRMTALPDSARPNERVLYDVTVCNAGALDATGTSVDVVLPNFLTSTQRSDGGTCTSGACGTGNLVAWDLGVLGAGRCTTVNMSSLVTGTLAGQVIPLQARLQADGGTMAVAARNVVVDPEPSLGLVLFEDAEPTRAGATVLYTLTAGNLTAQNIAETTLRFAAPAGTTVASVSDDGAEAGGEVTWEIGSLGAGDSIQRRVRVTVDESLADGTMIVAESELTGGDAERFGARSVQATSLVSSEPLSLRILASPDPARENDRVAYELTACNAGQLDVTGVAVDVRIPNDLTSALRTDGGTCTSGACGTGNLAAWDLGVLAAGRCRTVGLLPLVSGSTQATPIPLTARLLGDAGSIALAGRTVVADSDQPITTALVEETDPAAPGSDVSYAVTFGNRGDATVTDGELRIALPAGATLVTASNGAVLEGDELAWDLCPLSPGHSGTLSFTVTLGDSAALPDGSLLSSDAQVSGDVGAHPRSRADSFAGVLDASPLRLDLTADLAVAGRGDLVTYDLTACNDSVDQATGVSVRMFPPRGTNVTTIEDGGTQAVTSEIQWALDTLDAGICETVSLVVTVAPSTSFLGDGTVVFSSARLVVDGGDTAAAHHALRLCDAEGSACNIRPPLPCGAPQTRSCTRTASDALTILRTAVGLRACPLCECDIDGSSAITASDALGLLRFSVGNPVELRCPPCF